MQGESKFFSFLWKSIEQESMNIFENYPKSKYSITEQTVFGYR